MFSKFLKKNKNYLDSKSKNDLLHNVYILYLVFAIATIDIFYFLQIGDFYSATVFVSVGILVSFISKNMIVILCIAMFISHVFKFGSKWKEGFESASEEDNVNDNDNDNVHDDVSDNVDIDNIFNNKDKSENEDDQVQNDKKSKLDKSLKKLKTIEKITSNPDNISMLLENQSEILDKIKEYQPLLNTVQNISKNLGLNNS